MEFNLLHFTDEEAEAQTPHLGRQLLAKTKPTVNSFRYTPIMSFMKTSSLVLLLFPSAFIYFSFLKASRLVNLWVT